MVTNTILKVIEELEISKEKLKISGWGNEWYQSIDDAIEILSIIPQNGINNFSIFKKIMNDCNYTSYDKDELLKYVLAVNILNEATIRIVCETEKEDTLFDEPKYVVGNISDCYITKEQYEVLKAVGFDEIEVCNG